MSLKYSSRKRAFCIFRRKRKEFEGELLSSGASSDLEHDHLHDHLPYNKRQCLPQEPPGEAAAKENGEAEVMECCPELPGSHLDASTVPEDSPTGTSLIENPAAGSGVAAVTTVGNAAFAGRVCGCDNEMVSRGSKQVQAAPSQG